MAAEWTPRAIQTATEHSPRAAGTLRLGLSPRASDGARLHEGAALSKPLLWACWRLRALYDNVAWVKIIVFGSTGATGLQIVEQALAAGHYVTAFARTPSKMTIVHPHLRVVEGNVLDAASVEHAVVGHDAIFIALGTQLKETDKTISLGTDNIIAAMKQHGVTRVIAESAWGTGDSREHGGFLLNQIIRPFFLKHPFAEHELQERSLAASGLAWTSVRPGRLTNGPKVRTLRASRAPDGLAQKVARSEVAAFMLTEAEKPAHVGQAILVG